MKILIPKSIYFCSVLMNEKPDNQNQRLTDQIIKLFSLQFYIRENILSHIPGYNEYDYLDFLGKDRFIYKEDVENCRYKYKFLLEEKICNFRYSADSLRELVGKEPLRYYPEFRSPYINSLMYSQPFSFPTIYRSDPVYKKISPEVVLTDCFQRQKTSPYQNRFFFELCNHGIYCSVSPEYSIQKHVVGMDSRSYLYGRCIIAFNEWISMLLNEKNKTPEFKLIKNLKESSLNLFFKEYRKNICTSYPSISSILNNKIKTKELIKIILDKTNYSKLLIDREDYDNFVNDFFKSVWFEDEELTSLSLEYQLKRILFYREIEFFSVNCRSTCLPPPLKMIPVFGTAFPKTNG